MPVRIQTRHRRAITPNAPTTRWEQMKLAVALLSIAVCAGCSKQPVEDANASTASTSTQGASASPAAQARKTFRTVCVSCHGSDGKGDGPGAAALNPKPRDYTNVEWQNGVTDEQLQKTILMGGAAVGKSPAMPAQPQLQDKPEVVAELIKIIRGFKGK